MLGISNVVGRGPLPLAVGFMNPVITRLVTFVALLASSSVVQAQEAVWSVRVGGGILAPADTSTTLDAETSATVGGVVPVFSFDARRRIDSCCLEMVFSVIQPSIPVKLAGGGSERSAGRIGPTGYHVGLNYRFWQRNDTALYWSMMAGGIVSSKSEPAQFGSRRATFKFAGAPTFGGGIGFRRVLGDPNGPNRHDRRYSFDLSMLIAHAEVDAGGDNDGLSWHPVIVTAGLAVRLR